MILANDVKLAIKLKLNGVFTVFNKNFNHLSYSLKKDFNLLGSAHNIKEIKIKEKQKVSKFFIINFQKNKNC